MPYRLIENKEVRTGRTFASQEQRIMKGGINRTNKIVRTQIEMAQIEEKFMGQAQSSINRTEAQRNERNAKKRSNNISINKF